MWNVITHSCLSYNGEHTLFSRWHLFMVPHWIDWTSRIMGLRLLPLCPREEELRRCQDLLFTTSRRSGQSGNDGRIYRRQELGNTYVLTHSMGIFCCVSINHKTQSHYWWLVSKKYIGLRLLKQTGTISPIALSVRIRFLHCRPRGRDIFLFGHKWEFIARLIYVCIFFDQKCHAARTRWSKNGSHYRHYDE